VNAISPKQDSGWPTNRSLLFKLRTSEAQRIRWGRIAQHVRDHTPTPSIRHKECQWITGELAYGKPTPMCCAAVVEGTSWCAKHHAVVFIPPFMAGDEPE
jgi:hypothetical protein